MSSSSRSGNTLCYISRPENHMPSRISEHNSRAPRAIFIYASLSTQSTCCITGARLDDNLLPVADSTPCNFIADHLIHTPPLSTYSPFHPRPSQQPQPQPPPMSRGGRGGSFRGGRGGAIGPGGKARIGGQEMTWEHDPDLKIDTKPSEMFPPIHLPSARPPTAFERASVARFRALRRRIHEGPFYTGVLGENVRVSKAGGLSQEERRRADFNPFEDVQRYTQRYQVQARRLPRFDGREFRKYFWGSRVLCRGLDWSARSLGELTCPL